jgi:hypothetical protein
MLDAHHKEKLDKITKLRLNGGVFLIGLIKENICISQSSQSSQRTLKDFVLKNHPFNNLYEKACYFSEFMPLSISEQEK